MPEAIRIGEPAIEVRLRRNARARRMVLRVATSGRVPTLTLPPGVPVAHARAFLADHEGWLRRHLSAGAARVPVGEGSVLPFGDGTLTLRRQPGRGILRSGEVLAIGGPAAALGLRPGRITLRDPRSRWGSCTAEGDLMFSWRLVMAPPAVLDYVVAHEVAHLAELNHSPRFWAVVRRLCPGVDAWRDWLRRNGASLHHHDFGSGPA